ncbi:MAG: hypothetical protein HY329_22210 [Chloroflexi bacterium]|nr:hypothetical protein [Chloroflexota bacterium]
MLSGALFPLLFGGIEMAAVLLSVGVVLAILAGAWVIAVYTSEPPPKPARPVARIEREVGELLTKLAIADRSEASSGRERAGAPMKLAPHDERLYRPLTELSEPLSSRLN